MYTREVPPGATRHLRVYTAAERRYINLGGRRKTYSGAIMNKKAPAKKKTFKKASKKARTSPKKSSNNNIGSFINSLDAEDDEESWQKTKDAKLGITKKEWYSLSKKHGGYPLSPASDVGWDILQEFAKKKQRRS